MPARVCQSVGFVVCVLETLLPVDTCCPSCKGDLVEIGRDESQRLDVIPVQYRVIVTADPNWPAAPVMALSCRTPRQNDWSRADCYLYDFGDSWDHVIKFEKWCDNTTIEGLHLLLEAAGRCPPEDVGGAPGECRIS